MKKLLLLLLSFVVGSILWVLVIQPIASIPSATSHDLPHVSVDELTKTVSILSENAAPRSIRLPRRLAEVGAFIENSLRSFGLDPVR